ncbi:shikimate kinase [Bacillus haikouensis]|jgi:shikimate kinase|uniref:shikimate kinase n=1 Tax=Bacillus haikouensis TaxID=1510468 RepID=UPI0015581F53|nr:shikimate kinase [Bacillus haikouensis]NQD66737.1 shikimate kinase [Bacillus haikouensis]
MAIFLIGFMGAGKTTVGKRLGEIQKLQVIDIDEYIEEKTGSLIKDMFKEYGENHFRTLESAALKELMEKEAVITTGGGIVERKENIELLAQERNVFHLFCSFDVLWGRLEGDSNRPLVQKNSVDGLSKLYGRRLPLYRSVSTMEIDTTNKSIDEIISELGQKISTD